MLIIIGSENLLVHNKVVNKINLKSNNLTCLELAQCANSGRSTQLYFTSFRIHYGIHCLSSSRRRGFNLPDNSTTKTMDCRLRVNDECVPKLAVEGSNLFGLNAILLLARRIKALLQKRSFLTCLITAYFKSKASIIHRRERS